VVGPLSAELEQLETMHETWLAELQTKGPDAAKRKLASYIFPSVNNLSSIVVMMELNKKMMLFTGDARGDMIVEGLKLVGLMSRTGKIHVDLLKIPNHGASHNTDYRFLESVTADHYVISGNGADGCPERETVETLMNVRGDDDYTLHFNYPLAEIDARREQDWQKSQSKERQGRSKTGKTRVRPDWSSTKQSLQVLIGNPRSAKKIRVASEGGPTMISLLDEVGF
jgi:hypothetical protein